jgi:hypothetical protein
MAVQKRFIIKNGIDNNNNNALVNVSDFSGVNTGDQVNIAGNAATASAVAFSGITNKPTTLAGYGITDAASTSGQAGKPPITGNFAGPLVALVGTARYYPPANITISSVYFSVGTTPSAGGIVRIDVKINGVSIFASALPTLESGQYKSSVVSLTVSVTPLQHLTIDVAASSGGASDATVFLVVD